MLFFLFGVPSDWTQWCRKFPSLEIQHPTSKLFILFLGLIQLDSFQTVTDSLYTKIRYCSLCLYQTDKYESGINFLILKHFPWYYKVNKEVRKRIYHFILSVPVNVDWINFRSIRIWCRYLLPGTSCSTWRKRSVQSRRTACKGKTKEQLNVLDTDTSYWSQLVSHNSSTTS